MEERRGPDFSRHLPIEYSFHLPDFGLQYG